MYILIKCNMPCSDHPDNFTFHAGHQGMHSIHIKLTNTNSDVCTHYTGCAIGLVVTNKEMLNCTAIHHVLSCVHDAVHHRTNTVQIINTNK